MPKEIREEDYFLLHLGDGNHKFVKGIYKWYHTFEEIPDEQKKIWIYKRSVLNEYDSSESNILSIGINQKIISDFIYDDITVVPKMYLAKRTKFTTEYFVGSEKIECDKLQIEIDMTTEDKNEVTIYECKNGFTRDFAIYQIFLPCLYYHVLAKENNIPIKKINACYIVREKNKQQTKENNLSSTMRMYLYEFRNVEKIDSIHLIKSFEYRLEYK